MGMYTGFRFKGLIKQKYRQDIYNVIYGNKEWEDCENEIFKEFSKVDRSYMIPNGISAYLPDCWYKDSNNHFDSEATNGFELYFNNTTGLLCFQCEVKNYEPLEYFIKEVSKVICSKLIHAEILYEGNEISTLYKLKDGIIIQKEYGIRYKDDDEYESIFPIPKEEKEDKNIWYYDFKYDIEKEYR